MRHGSKYRFCREGEWSLWVFADRWSQGLWEEVLHQLNKQAPAHRPQTERFHYLSGENGDEFYLKIYHRSAFLGTLKDLFRDSKAFRALKQGEALSERGFHVPLTIAAGEERNFRLLKRAFLLTLGIRGVPLHLFLREHFLPPLDLGGLRRKREYLERLALETRRLHRHGFVHGDLVPSNILVQAGEGGITFFYMDNDRTRHYPLQSPHFLMRRNLVQLNRFTLTGISLQDRMRFLRFYLGQKSWGERERRWVRWLEDRTRKRRQEYERIEAKVSFRELMRWNGPFTRDIQ
ncbi:MAG: lipopolysaccharide kinase InaA family protein [Candidatus Binatia bacterium]